MAQVSLCAHRAFLKVWRMHPARKFLSTTTTRSSKVTLDMQSDGVAVLRMNNKPINSLSLDLTTELNTAFDEVDADRSCRGLIIASDLRHVFCSGLDWEEVHQPKMDRLTEYWRQFQEMWISLYGLRVPTIAAINGNAVGCVLALACDYRIMAQGKYTIGLVTTQMGVVTPYWVNDMMVATLGQRQTERGLQLGYLWPADDALKIGLIDEIVPESDVLKRAQSAIEDYMAVPDAARHIAKLSLRHQAISKLRSRQEDDINNFTTHVMQDWVQESVAAYAESLEQKPSM